jgi:hypothetical protein
MEKCVTSKKKVSMGLIISCCIWCHGPNFHKLFQ